MIKIKKSVILITFLLNAHILFQSIIVTAREDPWAAMNNFRPSTVIPLLRTPRTVGKRGSSLRKKLKKKIKKSTCTYSIHCSTCNMKTISPYQPLTSPSLTNQVSLRLESTVF